MLYYYNIIIVGDDGNPKPVTHVLFESVTVMNFSSMYTCTVHARECVNY